MKFLFWNTYRNIDINNTLSELIIENDISVVILAEYTAKMTDLIDILAMCGVSMRQYDSCCDRIKLLGSLSNIDLKLDASHHTIQIINDKDILCCVHLNSKLDSDHEGYREILMEEIVRDIQTIEQELGTDNSIIVGDFNINPYEDSCIDARYFHGISVYEEAERKLRKVSGKEFYMFYNPMWNFLGDFNKPYGTYYNNSGGVKNPYWNIFDQVIIRPTLRNRFVDKNLKIVTETKNRYLLDSKGHPDKKISDHLPIIFEIVEEE